MKPSPDKILVIAGPTASGKSNLAFRLASDFSGEIISADSMQVYRGLDIGTAKAGREEQRRIPHHLIDIFDISEAVDVFSFRQLISDAVSGIRERGNLPVIAGGSGLYIRAFLYGLDPLPSDRALRARIDEKYAPSDSLPELRELMREKDPQDLARWHDDHRKLLRALEVFSLTGKSISELQNQWSGKLKVPALVWNLCPERDELRKRIEARTARMLEEGWIEEAGKMIGMGLLESPTARQALGYRIIGEYLDGRISFEVMKTKISTATWQFARRQISWFRNKHPEAEKIPVPYNYEILKRKAEELFL